MYSIRYRVAGEDRFMMSQHALYLVIQKDLCAHMYILPSTRKQKRGAVADLRSFAVSGEVSVRCEHVNGVPSGGNLEIVR
jgi:hypothetical protein